MSYDKINILLMDDDPFTNSKLVSGESTKLTPSDKNILKTNFDISDNQIENIDIIENSYEKH